MQKALGRIAFGLVALGLSVAVHGGLLGLMLLAMAAPRPFDPHPEEAVTVDVVLPNEVAQPSAKPPEPAAESGKAQPASAPKAPDQKAPDRKAPDQGAPLAPPTPQASAPQAPAPQATGPQAPGPQAPGLQASEAAPSAQGPLPGFLDPAGTLAIYNLRIPPSQFDSKAEAPPNLTVDELASFKTHLRKCWRPPAGLTPTSGTRVVIRVSLTPDGGLAGEPALIEATAASDGPQVMRAAMSAIAQCQPFSFLPRDRYREWKQLDVSFSAREMSGG